jgi:hypothetical protein
VTSVFDGPRSPSMCKWIDAARLSKIGRARNSSKNGDRGFCLTFADLGLHSQRHVRRRAWNIRTHPPAYIVQPLVSCSEVLVRG